MNRPGMKNWVMVVVLTSFLVGCSPSSPSKALNAAEPQPVASPTPKAAIHLQPCQLGKQSAQCGVLSVYENRATNTGRKIELHVAVIKASEPNPATDPIFYLAGGPGGSGINAAGYAMLMLKSANRRRDLVLFDQRGTGQSNRMACPRQAEESAGLVPIDDKMTQDLRTCLSNLDGDPSAYTTAWGMDDLDDIRAALGYDQINLYGESYGTTAEQVYLERHGEHVRTMALEGVSLIDVAMFERMPRSSQEALDLMDTRCRADPACQSAYPKLNTEIKELIARLEKKPVEVSLIDPETGQHVTLTRDWLVLAIHNGLLLTPTTAQLPALLHQAYLGDWSMIEKILSNSFAPDGPKPEWVIMNLTILCHEDWARMRREETAQFSTGSYMGYEDVRRFSGAGASMRADPPPAAGSALPAGDHLSRSRPDHQQPGRPAKPAGECRLRKRPLPEQPGAGCSRTGSRLYGFHLPGSDPGGFHRKRNDARIERGLPAAGIPAAV